MIADYALEAGKYAGCLLSDVPREELNFLAYKSNATATDRSALKDYLSDLRYRRRWGLSWRQEVRFPHPGDQNATAGACEGTAGHLDAKAGN